MNESIVNHATLKQLLKRGVFNSRLKPDSESQVKMSAGRLLAMNSLSGGLVVFV